MNDQSSQENLENTNNDNLNNNLVSNSNNNPSLDNVNNQNENNNNSNNLQNNVINNPLEQNNNNENILQNNENRNNQYPQKYFKFTLSFIIILSINIIIKFYSNFNIINKRKYVFQYGPIFYKNQYYRLISSYFIHYGNWHLFVELYITFYACYYLENFIGTSLTILLIMISMIINNFLHFLIIPVVKISFQWILFQTDKNLDYEGGLTSVLFTISTFYYLFKNNKDQRVEVLYTFYFPGRYTSLVVFIVLLSMTPNSSTYGNMCGMLSGFMLKNFGGWILPKIIWIVDFEKSCNLKKIEKLYRIITPLNLKMKDALNEFEEGSMNFNEESNSILYSRNNSNRQFFDESGQHQMTELSNVNNNENNNNNANI